MCPACRTPDGKIVGAGINFHYVGTHKETAQLLTKCKQCGNYYLLDSFSRARESVDQAWVNLHLAEFDLEESNK
jgi:hypothetical protein